MGKIKNRKLNKKGFTLIELLAVIVILAILILLAMPSVLRIMGNARRNAFKTEISSYLKAAQTQYAETAVTNSGLKTMCFSSAASITQNFSSKSDCTNIYKLDIDGGNIPTYEIIIKNTKDGTKYDIYFKNSSYQIGPINNFVHTKDNIDDLDSTLDSQF